MLIRLGVCRDCLFLGGSCWCWHDAAALRIARASVLSLFDVSVFDSLFRKGGACGDLGAADATRIAAVTVTYWGRRGGVCYWTGGLLLVVGLVDQPGRRLLIRAYAGPRLARALGLPRWYFRYRVVQPGYW